MMAEERALFWKLTEAEHLRARAFCRKLMGNRDDGDDLYHDVLVAALPRFGQLRDRRAFRPWLYRIVVNTFKNRVRQPWWRRLIPITRELEEAVSSGSVESAQAARRRLEWAFQAITPQERALVTLFELEGWPMAELAKLFGKSEGAVKMRLSRARRKMREALVKRFHQPTAAISRAAKEREDGLCVAVRPSED
jgi:RNA polymerase sigma-70 factor (ECF subfamily)